MRLRDRWRDWVARAERLEREVHVLWFGCRDPRTPWYAKALVVLAVGYAVSPVDPIPDFLPVVGLLDELLVVPLLAGAARRALPDPVLADCRRRADERVTDRRVRALGLALALALWVAVAAGAVALL